MSTSPPERPPLAARLFDRWNARLPTAGELALAALAVGAATGVALAAGYDVAAPRRALALLELTSAAGRALRGVHAWTGHLLVVLAVAHAVEHLAARADLRVRPGPWLRVALSVPLLLALPLSGFALKGDAEGELARLVVAGLLERLPGGAAVAAALVGAGSDLQLVLLHHGATLTLAVLLVAVEHGRRLLPSAGAVVGLTAAALAGAALRAPGLDPGFDAAATGPWYLAPVQLLLGAVARPGWLWAAALGVGLLAVLPRLGPRARPAALGVLAAGVAAWAGGVLWAHRPSGPAPGSRSPARALRPLGLAALDPAAVPLVRGEPEGCLGCHREVRGIEAAHGAEVAGCSGCHLGDPFAPSAAQAHAGMVLVPGNLDTAALTCGRAGCHDGIVARVRGSPMAALRGIVAVDRWALGEAATPDGHATIHELGDGPADRHLRALCAACHLGRSKDRPGPITERSRGGGCVACHLREPAEPGARRDWAPERAAAFTHPRLSSEPRDEACFGCHSRSARIALSYAGWWESGLAPGEAGAAPPGTTRVLEDGRVLSRAEADVHHEKGMACVDCHTARETMGDGAAHLHEEQATRVRCTTCHRTAAARTVPRAALDGEAQAVVRTRFGDAPPPAFVAEDRTGEPLTNAWEGPDGTVLVRGKLTGRVHVSRPPAAACRALPGHARLSCQACHSAWSTSCVTCHTQWDRGGLPDAPWVEYDGAPRLDAPALGVLTRHGAAEIEPVTPGMILTVNGPAVPAPAPLPDLSTPLLGPGTRSLRAFAPSVPHTTRRAPRSCASCHAEPFALGYGRGTLALARDGGALRWRFEPAHPPWRDGLPEDAWIPFLAPGGGVATRRELAPLDLDAQRRTLAVGACLPCHDPATARGRELYRRFPESVRAAGPRCRVPEDTGR